MLPYDPDKPHKLNHRGEGDAGGRGHVTVVGTAEQVAGRMQEWFERGAADGFNFMAPALPGGLDDFLTLVISELQRRGLFRTPYEGSTLREHLGL